VVYGQPCRLCLFLSFPFYFLLDCRRSLMSVVVRIGPMEPKEVPITAPLRWWRWLWGLRSPIVVMPSFVSSVAFSWVGVGVCRHVVDLPVRLLWWMVLPTFQCITLTLLLLFLGCNGSVQPSATAFVRLAVFLHHFEQLLEGLWFDSVEHPGSCLPSGPQDDINGAAFGHSRYPRCQLDYSIHILLQ
jgi:hypothetical protein